MGKEAAKPVSMEGGGVRTILIIATFCLAAFSCELFSNKPEIDMEKAIDDAVQMANAPVLNVEVNEGGMGIASLRGTLAGIKQGAPFQLNYQANGNYPFYGWQARLEGSEDLAASWTPEGAFGMDKVTWVSGNITGTEVQVTIHIDPAQKIIIGPIGADAPVINLEVDEGVWGRQARGAP
jgi:hypothetical protein